MQDLQRRRAAVRELAERADHLEGLEALCRPAPGVALRLSAADDLGEALGDWALALVERNVRPLYERAWGWDAPRTRRELRAASSRYIVAWQRVPCPGCCGCRVGDVDGDVGDDVCCPMCEGGREAEEPVGFAMFRFEVQEVRPEDGWCVYLYELQLEEGARRMGLGTRLMRLVELVALRARAAYVRLTVFLENEAALALYRDKLGYSSAPQHQQHNQLILGPEVRHWRGDELKEWLRSAAGGRLQAIYADGVASAVPTGDALLRACAPNARPLPADKLPTARFAPLAAQVAALRQQACAVTLQRAWRMHAASNRMKASIERTNYRRCCAMEILSSEKKYLEQLCIITDQFMSPLPRDESVLTMAEIKLIFSDVAVIRAVSESVLESLQDRMLAWHHHQKIGDLFCEISDYLRVYTEYVKNYGQASALYSSMPESHPFKKFFEKQKKNVPEVFLRAPLTQFLITPVQRIPRYKLLLEDLLKHTWPEHVDYEDLAKAVSKINDIAEWVNENQKRYDRMEKMVGLQNSVTGLEEAHLQLLEASRQYVREGEVIEVIKKKLKRRYLMLFSDIAVLCDSKRNETSLFRKTNTTSKMQFMSKIDIATAFIKDVPDNDWLMNAFEICQQGKDPIVLCTEAAADKQLWLDDWTAAADKQRAHLKEMDEKTTKIAQVRADQARAILSQQYTSLRMRQAATSQSSSAAAAVSASASRISGGSEAPVPEPAPVQLPQVDASKMEERRQRRTSWAAKRGLTFFAMDVNEKWQVADEAQEALARLKEATRAADEARVARARSMAEKNKALLMQQFTARTGSLKASESATMTAQARAHQQQHQAQHQRQSEELMQRTISEGMLRTSAGAAGASPRGSHSQTPSLPARRPPPGYTPPGAPGARTSNPPPLPDSPFKRAT
eukprot:m51a1_g10324 hypothetical protein (905) ;mRNA; f:55053-60252